MTKLTPMQELFVAEYLVDLNAKQAAIRAGYSARTAEKQAYQLLQKTSVALAISTKCPIPQMEANLMNYPDPNEVANFDSILDFFRDHPLPEDDLDDEYLAAIHAAFPDGGDNLVSAAEETVTRRKMMILGLEVVEYSRQFDPYYDENGECLQVGYTSYRVPVVRLPDGALFALKHNWDLAELRAILNPPLEPAAEDGDRAP
jgi:hypothetical protein